MRRTVNHKTWAEMYPGLEPQGDKGIGQQALELYGIDPGTHGSVCAHLLCQTIKKWPGAKKDDLIEVAIQEHKDVVGDVLIYKSNVDGTRIAAPMAEQLQKFRRNLFAVWENAYQAARYQEDKGVAAAATDWPMIISLPTMAALEPKCGQCGNLVKNPEAVWYTTAALCARCYKISQSVPTKKPVNDNLALAHRDWSQGVRRVCESKAADGQPLWDWGMRNGIDGAAIILSAMQESLETARQVAVAVRDACTMHFPQDVRAEIGVTEPFDFVGFGVPQYLKIVSAARVPLPKGKSRSVCAMLVGPMGSGKSTAAEALADELGVPYGKVSMTRGTSPTAFNGKQRVTDDGSLLGVLAAIAKNEHKVAASLAQRAMSAGDVTVSQWVRIYTGGGVFLFDEIDAADSNLLLIVNDALSSAGFANTATGETLPRHESFVGVAAGNTIGLGADRIYGGRERLDGASLDRWAAGRVRVGYDNALEDSIIEGMVSV